MNRRVFFAIVLIFFAISAVGQNITHTDAYGNIIYLGQKKTLAVGKYSKNKEKPSYEVIAPLTPAVGKSEKIKNAIDTAWVPFVLETIQKYNKEIEGNVVVPKRLTIKDVNYPVTRIGVQAFKDCYKLKKIVLPLSITEIDMEAFANCTGLEEVILPPNLQKIGNSVFDNCKNLKTIQLYGNVPPEVGAHTDFNFLKLTVIVPPKTSEAFLEKEPWNRAASIIEREVDESSMPYSWFTAESGQKFLIQVASEEEKTISVISYSALTPYINTEESYDDVTGILKLPWSISYEDADYKLIGINENAFNGCGITELSVASSVEFIKKGAFKNCKNLSYVRIEGNKVEIAVDAFEGISEDAILSVPKLSGSYYKSLPACKKFKEIRESIAK